MRKNRKAASSRSGALHPGLATFAKRVQQALGVSLFELARMSEQGVQRQLAAKLRQALVDWARTSESAAAKTLRGDYVNFAGIADDQSSYSLSPTFSGYLNTIGKDGTWLTATELALLGDMLGAHTVVQRTTGTQGHWNAHRAQADDAPVIKLNITDNHWYVNSRTAGDGNCLLNATLQAVRQVAQQAYPEATQQVEHSTNATRLSWQQTKSVAGRQVKAEFNSSDAAVAHQSQQYEHYRAQILQLPKPSEVATMQQQEAARIAALPASERSQIQQDHQLALLAAMGKLEDRDIAPDEQSYFETMGFATGNQGVAASQGVTAGQSVAAEQPAHQQALQSRNVTTSSLHDQQVAVAEGLTRSLASQMTHFLRQHPERSQRAVTSCAQEVQSEADDSLAASPGMVSS